MENLVINKKFTTPIEQNDILKKTNFRTSAIWNRKSTNWNNQKKHELKQLEKARIETARKSTN